MIDTAVLWGARGGRPAELLPAAAQSVAWIPSVVLQAGALRAWRQRASDVDGLATAAGLRAGPWAVPFALLPAFVDAARDGLAGLERFREQVRCRAPVYDVPWEGAG